MIINKDLLKEVLGIKSCLKVDTTIKNNLHYTSEEGDKKINPYYLAHLCKKWAFSQGFIVTSNITINGDYNSSIRDAKQIHNYTPKLIKHFKGQTEYEAIIKACTYIHNKVKTNDASFTAVSKELAEEVLGVKINYLGTCEDKDIFPYETHDEGWKTISIEELVRMCKQWVHTKGYSLIVVPYATFISITARKHDTFHEFSSSKEHEAVFKATEWVFQQDKLEKLEYFSDSLKKLDDKPLYNAYLESEKKSIESIVNKNKEDTEAITMSDEKFYKQFNL